MKTVAGGALLSAMDEDIAIPAEYVRVLWAWLATAATASHWSLDKFAALPDERIRSESLSMLVDRTAGTNERRLAVQVLSGSGHARHVEDHALVSLVEAARTGAHAIDVATVIVAVHLARGVPRELLVGVRDRWSAGCLGMKEAAITLGLEALAPDLGWVARMLDDVEPDARSYVAGRLQRDGYGDLPLLDVVQARLAIEASPDVRGALYRALATLEEVETDRERRRRRRERLREEAAGAAINENSRS
jgi:hypothetical protein